ncbi:MAG: RecX family transcriptional regulator [Verrucomicrobia bacterium]|nr:RecX family transcriptional regulator [Verrucomicrobiota bacterium]MBU6446149.1 RecX family transcriptional regulator [Verrucomicrobiota bacterium]MDE3047759.1 RecX family transcriptional regulator [Verrucomicrobiota bacterium]
MEYTAARKRALWLLSKKNYHSEVLFRKLLDKGASEEVASSVIADCKRLGILSDEQAIVRELKRGWGPRAIAYKLRLKSAEVRKWISRDMQKARIAELIPKLGPREKAYRTLIRKGFDPELVIEIFSYCD